MENTTENGVAAPAVSIIVPTHNRSVLLMETVRSILDQTYRDFELIVISDGSTDDTESLIKSIPDSRIVFLARANSGRPAPPRNLGIKRACGRYIAFCDDDDLWEREKLELQIAAMERDPTIGLCCTNAKDLRGTVLSSKSRISFPGAHPGFGKLVWRNYVGNSTVVLRREVFDKVGYIDESPDLAPFDDYEMWLRIAYHYRIHFVDRPLIRYRLHENNIVPRYRNLDLIVLKALVSAGSKLGTTDPRLWASAIARIAKHFFVRIFG
jgi:glycosyltransferase involved in cell wall biosynthesis